MPFTSSKVLAIVNTAAGSGRCGKRAPELLETIRERGIDLSVRFTAGPNNAEALAAEGFRAGHRRFLAAGGDGTVSEVANGLMPLALEAGERFGLGVLPLGSGNSFLKDFAHRRGAEATIDALLENRSVPCDVVRLEHGSGTVFSLNLMTFGFPVKVAEVAKSFKRLGGGPAYFLAVLAALTDLDSFAWSMSVDREPARPGHLCMLAICNSKYTAGAMLIAPQANTADGRFDIISATPLSRFALLRVFPKIYTGTHFSDSAVDYRQASVIEFDQSQAVSMMIDGELRSLTPRRCDVLHNALDILV